MNQLSAIFIIAKYTIKDILKSRILLNIIFLGIGLLLVTALAYSFTYGAPQRVALDFGLGMLSLSSVAVSLFMGINLLSSEIESRTVYMILSRPVDRSYFILGKILGLAIVVLINTLILASLTLVVFKLTGGELTAFILMTIVNIYLEALIVLGLVSLLSLISTKVLSVIIAISIYIIGHAIDAAKMTTMVLKNELLSSFIDVYHFVLPGFYKLNLKPFVLYEQQISESYILGSALYGLLYFLALVGLNVIVFQRKSLD